MGKIQWSDDLSTLVTDTYSADVTEYEIEIDEDTSELFVSALQKNIAFLKNFGCHLIGKWNTSIDNTTAITALISYKLQQIFPRLLKLKGMFSTTPVSNTFEKDATNAGSHSGTSRSAGENSPITSASINSAPTESTEWDITNPNVKSGNQYDNAFENNFEESHTITDPDTYMRVLKFNTLEWNVFKIAKNFVQSITEEYNTVY